MEPHIWDPATGVLNVRRWNYITNFDNPTPQIHPIYWLTYVHHFMLNYPLYAYTYNYIYICIIPNYMVKNHGYCNHWKTWISYVLLYHKAYCKWYKTVQKQKKMLKLYCKKCDPQISPSCSPSGWIIIYSPGSSWNLRLFVDDANFIQFPSVRWLNEAEVIVIHPHTTM